MRLTSIGLAAAVAAGVGLWIAGGPPADIGDQAAASAAREPGVGAAAEAAGASEDGRPAPASAGGLIVETIEAQAQAWTRRFELRGQAEVSRSVEVSAQTSGLVVSEPRASGSRVAAGDVLCALETAERDARLTEARARRSQAEADARASRSLSERGFSSETSVAEDEAALRAAEAMVAQMEIDIERTQIRAPFGGVLEEKTAERGALLMPGDLCGRVVTLDPIKLVGFAPEELVGAIGIGTPVEARLPAGATLTAEVSFVSAIADPSTRTFRVEAKAANPDGAARGGMTATLALSVGDARAFLIPHAALTLDDGGRLGIRVVDEADRARFMPARVLEDGPDGVWIEAVFDRARVIVSGQEFVADGAQVRATRRGTE